MPLIDSYKSLVNQRINVMKFLDTFSSEEECLELYFNLKFTDLNCQKCGRPIVSNYSRVMRGNSNGVPKKAFRCRSCRTYIYPLSNTVFTRSTIPLNKLFFIIYILSNPTTSASSIDIASQSGIAYKTAHRLSMLIRKVMFSRAKSKMAGIIEIDEAFIGGGSKWYNWSKISTRKQPIIGMIERGSGHIRIFLVENRSAATINKLIHDNIETGSTIYTDSWKGYAAIPKYYTHDSVDHSKREYVRGNVHTQNIESFWGTFKRNLRKTHIKISAKYVQLYVDEACWRRNNRGKSQMQLFDDALRRTFFSGFD